MAAAMSANAKKALMAKSGITSATKDMPAIKEVAYIGEGKKGTNADPDNPELEAARKRAAAKAKDRKNAMLNAMGVDTEVKSDLQRQQEEQQLALAEARAANKVTIERRELPRLLVLGGFDGTAGGEGRMRLVDAFDWETRRWETIRMMRCKRRMHAAAVCLFPPLKEPEVGEDGFVVEEEEEEGYEGMSSEEDSSSEDEEALLPKPRVVVFGGQKNVDIYAESYDPETNKWVPLPERPPHMKHLQRYGCVAATWRDRLVCVGGQKNEFEPVASVEVYDPALADKEHLRWKLLPDLNFARTMCGLAVLQDTLVVAGGSGEGNHRLCSAEIYNDEYVRASTRYSLSPSHCTVCFDVLIPHTHTHTHTHAYSSIRYERWDRLPDMCFRRSGCYLSSLGGFLTVFGGMNNFGKLKSVEQYDPDLEKWVRIGDMPHERSCMAGTTFTVGVGEGAKEKVVLMGGRDRLYAYLDTVDIFDPMTGVWSSVKMPNEPENVPYLRHRRDTPACVVLGWPVYEEDDDLIEGNAPSPHPLAIEAAAAPAAAAEAKTAGKDEEKDGQKEDQKEQEEEEEKAEEDVEEEVEQGPEGQSKRASVIADEKRKRMIAEAAAGKKK